MQDVEYSNLTDESGTIRLPISILRADPKNPRKISDESSAGLKVSLETFGHARLLALGSDKPAERAIEIYSRRARHLVDPRINFSKIGPHG